MQTERGDWADAVRYFHGKGHAVRRSDSTVVFALFSFILALVTVLAVLSELG